MIKKAGFRFATFYRKPQLDLLTPISDDLGFRRLLSPQAAASQAEKPPQDLPAAFLFEGSFWKSYRRTKVSEIQPDLRAINEMIINSVY